MFHAIAVGFGLSIGVILAVAVAIFTLFVVAKIGLKQYGDPDHE